MYSNLVLKCPIISILSYNNTKFAAWVFCKYYEVLIDKSNHLLIGIIVLIICEISHVGNNFIWNRSFQLVFPSRYIYKITFDITLDDIYTTISYTETPSISQDVTNNISGFQQRAISRSVGLCICLIDMQPSIILRSIKGQFVYSKCIQIVMLHHCTIFGLNKEYR